MKDGKFEVGDLVENTRGYHGRSVIYNVVRITKTQAVLSNNSQTKIPIDGINGCREIGSKDIWSQSRYKLATPESILEIQHQNRIDKIEAMCKRESLQKLDFVKVKTIYNFLMFGEAK
jgi:hypothetical protein